MIAVLLPLRPRCRWYESRLKLARRWERLGAKLGSCRELQIKTRSLTHTRLVQTSIPILRISAHIRLDCKYGRFSGESCGLFITWYDCLLTFFLRLIPLLSEPQHQLKEHTD